MIPIILEKRNKTKLSLGELNKLLKVTKLIHDRNLTPMWLQRCIYSSYQQSVRCLGSFQLALHRPRAEQLRGLISRAWVSRTMHVPNWQVLFQATVAKVVPGTGSQYQVCSLNLSLLEASWYLSFTLPRPSFSPSMGLGCLHHLHPLWSFPCFSADGSVS